MKKKIKIILVLNTILMIFLLVYKTRLYSQGIEFGNHNYQNIQKLDSFQQENYSFVVPTGVESNFQALRKYTVPSVNSEKNVQFVISNGNNVTEGDKSEYLVLKDITSDLTVPVFFGLGANEARAGSRNYFEYFGNYYYSFSYGNSYYIFADTTFTSKLDEQQQWFETELAKSKDYSNTFVFLNDSPIDQQQSDKITAEQKQKLANMLSLNNIDFVIYNGQEINEDTVGGVNYISTGNHSQDKVHRRNKQAGYFLINVDNDNISYEYKEVSPSSKKYKFNVVNEIVSYIDSIQYFEVLDILFYLSIALFVFIYFYQKLTEPTNYYPDFSYDYEYHKGRKLKIAMFTNNYLPFIGGVPISIQRLSEELVKMGHEVVIFAPEYPEKIKEQNVVRVKLLHYTTRGNFNFAIANIFSKEYKQKFIEEDFDIVHVHHSFWLGTAGLNLAHKQNIPVVFTYHTRLEFYSENLPIGKTAFKNYFSHEMVYKFAQKCDGVIAPTQSAFEYLENIKVGTPKIISPTGIDFSIYQQQPPIENLRSSDDEVVLCTVSRLSVEKNIEFLIDGLNLLRKKTTTKFKCYIIGSGPEEKELKQKVSDLGLDEIIIFTGAIAPTKVVSYYMQSDIFVFASISETQGMVLLEAMAGHCPVVCINSSGVNDVVTNKYNGFKTNYDMNEWTKKLQLLVEDEKLRLQLAENAYNYSLDYSKEKIASNIATFYQKLVSKKEQNNEQR